MKRRLLKLGLLLLAGAIINVAVAWVRATDTNVYSSGIAQRGADPGWSVFVSTAWGATQVWSHRHEELLPEPNIPRASSLVPWWLPTAAPTPEWNGGLYNLESRNVSCFGWPMCSLFSEDECTFATKSGGRGPYRQARWGIQTGRARTFAFNDYWIGGLSPQITIPLGPIPLGFTIDTIFYAALVWLLFFAPFQLRRRRRIKRAQCPACAYPVGSSDKCTECGKPVKLRSVESVA